jgi:hypothetical protein
MYGKIQISSTYRLKYSQMYGKKMNRRMSGLKFQEAYIFISGKLSVAEK